VYRRVAQEALHDRAVDADERRAGVLPGFGKIPRDEHPTPVRGPMVHEVVLVGARGQVAVQLSVHALAGEVRDPTLDVDERLDGGEIRIRGERGRLGEDARELDEVGVVVRLLVRPLLVNWHVRRDDCAPIDEVGVAVRRFHAAIEVAAVVLGEIAGDEILVH
jgi:hypothetical protein